MSTGRFVILSNLLNAVYIGHFPIWSSQIRTGFSPCRCLVSPVFEFLDQKRSGSDTGPRDRAWISERPGLYSEFSDVSTLLT
jgi:hypothetical protein